MRWRAQLPMEFEADDEEQALERLQEIWSALDWTLVPQEYDVHIEDMHLGRRLA